jgi:aspartate aminotransferase-like enzyme
VFELRYNSVAVHHRMISLLPGPVEIAPEIQAAFHLPPVYHRSAEFVERFESVRASLRQLTGARNVALFNGSGTLANDVVASCLEGPGVILVNGEFGRRLADQARRWNLSIRVIEWPWGVQWDFEQIEASLGNAEWIWAVHVETSTGMINDVSSLVSLSRRRGVRLCLDCISSLGAVPLDLRDVWLASGVSGKALGSYGGIGIVFASDVPAPRHKVPTYLDLPVTLQTTGPCFTFSSPLLFALQAAVELKRDYQALGCLVRKRLKDIGTAPIVEECFAAPIVTTFQPPRKQFVEKCRSYGYHVGGESRYLQERGLVQIATMGAVQVQDVNRLFDALA